MVDVVVDVLVDVIADDFVDFVLVVEVMIEAELVMPVTVTEAVFLVVESATVFVELK